MFVCASTECFPDLSPQEVLEALADLGFTALELPIHETGRWLKPSEVHADLERSVHFCRDTHRLDIAALIIELAPGPRAVLPAFHLVLQAGQGDQGGDARGAVPRSWARRSTKRSSGCGSWSRSRRWKARSSA